MQHADLHFKKIPANVAQTGASPSSRKPTIEAAGLSDDEPLLSGAELKRKLGAKPSPSFKTDDLSSDEEPLFKPSKPITPKLTASSSSSSSSEPQAKAFPTFLLPNVASVETLAQAEDVDTSEAAKRLAHVKAPLLARIRKALALSSHPGTGEAEAKAALKVASAHMQRINITQADILATETKEDQSRRAGASTVQIISPRGTKVTGHGWVDTASAAVCLGFDVKCYTASHKDPVSRRVHTFYGLAQNTVAAAYAFEMCHNLILQWSILKPGLSGIVETNSYKQGAAAGLYQAIETQRKAEEREAELAASGTSSTASKAPEAVDDTQYKQWASKAQLVQFRQSTKEIAEGYLKKSNVKLVKGAKRKPTLYSDGAFSQGLKDGKSIDLKRQKLGGE